MDNQKTLYLIGGTMGVGKSTLCHSLKKKLEDCVFLDGDWCWDAHPFVVNEDTKEMVMENICFLLNNFLSCKAYRNVIFCWVMHQQEIIDTILEHLNLENVRVVNISLICTPKALKERLQRDIEAGIRSEDILERSLSRLSLYDSLNTIKLDVSDQSIDQNIELIISQKL